MHTAKLLMLLVVAFSGALIACGVQADLGADDRPNPFKPQSVQPVKQGGHHRRSNNYVRSSAAPRLRAVLRAPRGSMANLEGHILSEQESALGYRLLAVQEHSADFYHRGQRLRLYVRPKEERADP
ncbi:MAG: hypothetical protein ACR2PZ_03450 [Pseudomonadales bacterium]